GLVVLVGVGLIPSDGPVRGLTAEADLLVPLVALAEVLVHHVGARGYPILLVVVGVGLLRFFPVGVVLFVDDDGVPVQMLGAEPPEQVSNCSDHCFLPEISCKTV